jgi:GntR family transcriptional regulator/MocR family aminotransferase
MVNVFIEVDRGSERTLRQQLIEQMRAAIRNRRLPPGARLPATRLLAVQLGISRNVVITAFEELASEGYLEGRVGSGTYVARDLPLESLQQSMTTDVCPAMAVGPACRIAPSRDDAERIDFRDLTSTAIDRLPLTVWRGMWREIAGQSPPPRIGKVGDDADLRAAVAVHLARARGVRCAPEDIVITASAAHALDLLLRLVLPPGVPVAMEEPGCPLTRQTLLGRQARLVPVPVDADGLRVDRLPTGTDAPTLVYVTPAHQCPLGVRLPVARRTALLAWAEAQDRLIVEDDRGNEFLYDAPALPPLAELDTTGRVAYIGDFARLLAPSVSVGYLVLSPALRRRVARNGSVDAGLNAAAWPVQRAIAGFIGGTEATRHFRRMRRQYAIRRQALINALSPVRAVARLRGLDAGLHAWLELCPEIPAARVTAYAGLRRVLVGSVQPYYLGAPDCNGLLLGYGGLDEAAIARGGHILAEIIAEAARERGLPQPSPSPRA